MWKFSELPAAWQRQPDEELRLRASLELGLDPEAIQTRIDDPDTDFLPVLLTSQADFRSLASADERRIAMRDTLVFLLRTGKPPPHFIKTWGLRDAQSADVGRSNRRAV